tara:strand:- start:238 stop:2115 length:1878 start_codon:yes stop_codon:yes gene_type:complete
MKCILLGSGSGTSIKAVINAVKQCELQLEINAVIFNVENNELKSFCNENGVNYSELLWDSLEERNLYEDVLLSKIHNYEYDFIFFLGWNMIASTDFIKRVGKVIYNLHPSLPNQYVGTGSSCLKNAIQDFNFGKIKCTGSMIHKVSADLDRGEVMATNEVPMYNTDTLDILTNRVKSFEKGFILSFLHNLINENNQYIINDFEKETQSKLYIGKVRRVEDIGNGRLLLSASDRLSAFDNHICDVRGKGICLNKMSKWWFDNTKHIIDNHYIHSSGKHMIVRKTNPIKLEIVVRGYMTGASPTSIWTMYSKGERDIYGINFRDGYNKNEKLDDIIVTPTTKGKHDYPITEDEIVNQGYLSQNDYDFIKSKALELFRYGQKVARDKGFVLVDTKYEFGRLDDGSIILIDEIHTCDSSRYWFVGENEDYTNPKKLDKDIIRDYIKQNKTNEIPTELVNKVSDVYNEYLTRFEIENDDDEIIFYTGDEYVDYYFNNIHNEIVVVLAGSYSDSEFVQKIMDNLKNKDIYGIPHFYSAHRNPKKVLEILERYDSYSNRKIVFVTVAGRSNALSGVVAANTKYPVIACPPFKDKTDFQVNINSTLQMPSNVPVMTILEPANVALSVKRIFSL